MNAIEGYMERFRRRYLTPIPKRNVDTEVSIWTPAGVSVVEVETYDEHRLMMADGSYPQRYQVTVRDPETGKAHRIDVLGTTRDGQAEIEDRLASAIESTLLDEREKEQLRAPSESEKEQIAGALRDWREQFRKRSESSTGKLHFWGLH